MDAIRAWSICNFIFQFEYILRDIPVILFLQMISINDCFNPLRFLFVFLLPRKSYLLLPRQTWEGFFVHQRVNEFPFLIIWEPRLT